MAPRKTAMSESQMQKVTTNTAEELKAQPKKKVRLYLAPEEKKRLEEQEKAGKNVQWPSEFVGINGHNFVIHRGKDVEVPQSVYEVLEHAGMV